MYKFQITKVENGNTIIEVFKGNDIILTREFSVDLDFNLDEIRKQLKSDIQILEVKKEEEERIKNKEDDLKLKIGKKFDL